MVSYIQAMTSRYLQDVVCLLGRPVFPIDFTPFFAQIHFGAKTISGLTAPTYFGAIDPTGVGASIAAGNHAEGIPF